MWSDAGHQILDAGWEAVEIRLRHGVAAEDYETSSVSISWGASYLLGDWDFLHS
jgi:hypothetical protein